MTRRILVTDPADPPSDGEMPSYDSGTDAWTSAGIPAAATQYTRVVMRVGITDPPEPVSNPGGDGWVYMLVDV